MYVVLFYFIVIHDPCLLTYAAPNGYRGIIQNLTFTSAVTEHNFNVSIQNDDNVVELLDVSLPIFGCCPLLMEC